MQEYSVPAAVVIDDTDNLSNAVFRNAEQAPSSVVFTRKVDGSWSDITAQEFADDVQAVAKGLIAAGVGVGDRVGLLSRTRYEWTLVDYAVWSVGGVTVPVYETSSSEQIGWNLGDSGAVAVVVETAAHQEAVDEVKGELPDLANLWQIDAGGLDTLRELGATIDDSEVLARRQAVNPDSTATLIYTSGTTGRPKGCELTHRNLMFDCRTTTDGLRTLFNEDGSTLLFLPLAHVFARLIQVGCVENRVRMGHTADVKNLLPDLATFQPTFLLSVPRVFEKVYNSAKAKAHADGKGSIFDRAEQVAITFSEQTEAGHVSLPVKLQHLVFDKLVYTKLRGALGGKVANAISGGAPLGARLGHFFRGIGMPIYEGYGLTETSAGATVNLEGAVKVGTVGRPIPGVTVRISDDGEILLSGDNIFRGYWHNEQATSETLDGQWFHTGDIGELDTDGFLTITGRKKELIVTAGGKNVAPAVLEDRVRAHALISQCIVVGDQKPFIACLITVDAESLPAWLTANGKDAGTPVADLVHDETLRAEIQAAVDTANKAVSKAEAIRKFDILPVDFTEDGGQLTPTLKLKRGVVMQEFGDRVEGLYS